MITKGRICDRPKCRTAFTPLRGVYGFVCETCGKVLCPDCQSLEIELDDPNCPFCDGHICWDLPSEIAGLSHADLLAFVRELVEDVSGVRDTRDALDFVRELAAKLGVKRVLAG